ncbi:MAG: sigma-54 dependent transcriptional regulator [Bacteroidales bacterium]|nr:sigma-54 dependent transcriptional regulator [Bacteroidales bacterium]
MKTILIIDDDTYICNLLVGFLEQKGYKAEGCYSGVRAKKLIEAKDYSTILCDYRLPETNGYEMLKFIKSKKPDIPVIIITAYSDVRMAVKLIKSGAFDYVTKPVQPDEILHLINRAIEEKKVRSDAGSANFTKEFISGTSEQVKKIMEHVRVVAATGLTVLIEGETGSGKEYIARAIHHYSNRKNKPFVPVDCGAMPKDLANSELFGHIKGAFTGAISDKSGHFEQAEGGTIFLDEVANLPYENQAKLLRALQERVISRVGENKHIKVDVRLLAASNDNLVNMLDNNEFREDLYHRLNEFKITLPPLRERTEDIMEFAGEFITRANTLFGKNVTGLDDDAVRLFLHYEWPGNIRELKNVINRAVLLSDSGIIKAQSLPDEIRFSKVTGNHFQREKEQLSRAGNLKEATEITEKDLIISALIKCNWNKSKAAKLLSIDRKTLYNKIKHYDIENAK